MTDTDPVAELRARLEAAERQAAERIEALQRRLMDRAAYAELVAGDYARAKLDREAAERDELARLGPEFTREQLRDSKFYQEHAAEIEQAAKNGRITNVGGIPDHGSAAREAVREQMRRDGTL